MNDWWSGFFLLLFAYFSRRRFVSSFSQILLNNTGSICCCRKLSVNSSSIWVVWRWWHCIRSDLRIFLIGFQYFVVCSFPHWFKLFFLLRILQQLIVVIFCTESAHYCIIVCVHSDLLRDALVLYVFKGNKSYFKWISCSL